MNERLLREWISTLLVEQSKSTQLKFNAGNATEGLVAAALGAVIRNHGMGDPRGATRDDMLDIIASMSGNSSQFDLGNGDTLTVSFALAAAELKAIKQLGTDSVKKLNDYIDGSLHYANRKNIQKFAARLAKKGYRDPHRDLKTGEMDIDPDTSKPYTDSSDKITVAVVGGKDARSKGAKEKDPTADVAIFVNDDKQPTSLTPSVKIDSTAQLAQGRADFSSDDSPATRMISGKGGKSGFASKLGTLASVPEIAAALVTLEAELAKILDPINVALATVASAPHELSSSSRTLPKGGGKRKKGDRFSGSRTPAYEEVNMVLGSLGYEAANEEDATDMVLSKIAKDAIAPFAETLATAMTKPTGDQAVAAWKKDMLPHIASFFSKAVGSQEFVKIYKSNTKSSGKSLRGRPEQFEKGLTSATESGGSFTASHTAGNNTVFIELEGTPVFQFRIRRDLAGAEKGTKYTFVVRLYLEAKNDQALLSYMKMAESYDRRILFLRTLIRETLIIEELTKTDVEKIAKSAIEKDRAEQKRIIKKEIESELKSSLGTSFFGNPGKVRKAIEEIVQDELSRSFGGGGKMKDQVADITKAVLKKMYREISHSYNPVIDRIRI